MDSEPSTSAGGSIHRAPAMPMWSTASTRRSARARAVCSAASTGPIPQQKVSASRTNASSRSVAATTRSMFLNDSLTVTVTVKEPSRPWLPVGCSSGGHHRRNLDDQCRRGAEPQPTPLPQQPPSAADLAANLPGRILRGVHVHVQQVLAEILDHGRRHLRLAGLAVLA